MRCLELFSGTKSVGKAICHDYEVISVDICNKFQPTHNENVLTWNYKQYPPNYFDAIWASPPCTEYSILKNNTGMNVNLELADSLVLRTFEILDYFNPKRWYIENPHTSLLKSRPFMMGLDFYAVDYCRFSNWGYRKRTCIWTNVKFDHILCEGEGKCPNMNGRFHRVSFGGQGRPKAHVYETCPAGTTAYRVPELLIKRLFAAPIA